uniref:Rubis-subs-bind domain-containing protein n=1 Tax=Echinostoma caproni TaxID=27848 RepID=A0A183AFL8_9TREM
LGKPMTAMPNFFPPTSSIASVAFANEDALDARAVRLRELRLGRVEFTESLSDSTKSALSKSETDSLRQRVNSRIAAAINQLNAESRLTLPRETTNHTGDDGQDPLGALLSDYRAQRLKIAERIFTSKS